MYPRNINLSKSNSFFLFGARATGKSTLLKEFVKYIDNYLWIDLLDPLAEQELSAHPSRLLDRINALSVKPEWIIIDEIQKIPKLLDLVHKLIFEQGFKFALTGSSARKLKRGNANMLAGRAFSFKLYPLTFLELGDDFDLTSALQWGTLPALQSFNDVDRRRYLSTYTQTYIKEEILVEQLVRKIEPFRSFLEVAAQSNTEIVNYSNIARQANIQIKSVERYFEIINDTLLGFFLEPYSLSVRKRQSHKPKFYFFDIGIVRSITNNFGSGVTQRTYGFGKLFEHFIINEFIRLNEYFEKYFRFSYIRTKDNAEVDLVIETGKETILVEIKSTDNVTEKDMKTLKTLGSEISKNRYILCLEKTARVTDGIKIFPWQDGIKDIYQMEHF